MMMIAFITIKSSLVPLIEGLSARLSCNKSNINQTSTCRHAEAALRGLDEHVKRVTSPGFGFFNQ